MFKEVIQNPRYTGPILIMLLFVAANSLAAYILAAKTCFEGTFPQKEGEGWTENPTLWTASVNNSPFTNSPVKENRTDYIRGGSYGNKSIEFQAENCTSISFKVDLEGVNCSSLGGYEKLYLRVKLVSPDEPPEKVFLNMYSTYPSNGFSQDLTLKFLNTTSKFWNNLTLNLANPDWRSFGGDWSNITCLTLEFTWKKPSKVWILLDGLFFGGIFRSYMENFASYIANYAAYAFMQFIIRWVMLGGFMYIMSKAFKAQTVWRVVLVLAGSALITMFIHALINAAAFSTLPKITYPFELTGGVPGEGGEAYNRILEETSLVNQVYSYTSIAIMLWTVLLCAVALRLATGFSWTTTLLIAIVANFLTSFIERFLTGV
ncbi:MAG: hypothetical protein QXD45_01615 [Candidatus Bathyarchaeia archaeon]